MTLKPGYFVLEVHSTWHAAAVEFTALVFQEYTAP